MNIAVVTDSNAGFSKEEAEKLNINILRMPIIIDNEIYYEGQNLSYEEFFQKQEKGCDIKTSQPAPYELVELWTNLLKEYDAVLHIPMSSGLSNSTQSAKLLAEDEFPNKVFVVDNHRISVTLKQSVYDALYLISKGYSPLEIKNILEKESFNSTIYIMVNTLKYLKKGGRITPAAALIGTALHLKPVLSIYGEKLDAYAKCLGTKKAKATLISAIENDLNNKFKDIDRNKLIISMAYTHNIKEANVFKEELMKKFNLKDIIMDPLSLSVSTHIGPGALACTVSKILR